MKYNEIERYDEGDEHDEDDEGDEEIFFSNVCHSCAQIALCAPFPGMAGAGLLLQDGAGLAKTKKLKGSTGRAAAKVECFHGSGQGGVRMPFFLRCNDLLNQRRAIG